MGNLEIQAVQSGTTQQAQSKPQTKKENIVIEFTSLPDNMKTQKVREFYDKDGSGFLESCNANGQDEVALMQQAFGLDLSKYKSDIVKTTKEKHDDICNIYTGFDKKGQKIVEIAEYSSNFIFEQRYKQGQNKIELIDDNNKIIRFNKSISYNRDYKELNAIEVNADGTTISKFYYEDGYLAYMDNYKDGGIYSMNGKKIMGIHDTLTVTENLTQGKNVITKNDVYELDFEHPNKIKTTVKEAIKKAKKQLVETYMTLNGKKVQAKPIGKGRYEVTDETGNVFYISHDGVKLKPEYVRNNP